MAGKNMLEIIDDLTYELKTLQAENAKLRNTLCFVFSFC